VGDASALSKLVRRTSESGSSSPLSRVLTSARGGAGPVPGEELVEACGAPEIDKACEQVGEVGLRIDDVELAGLCRPPNYAERF
jgi:hypothetical protein